MNEVLNQVIEDYKFLYEREKEKRKELQQENQQLKKQKDDVVEYIKSLQICTLGNSKTLITEIIINILRMLGEIDE